MSDAAPDNAETVKQISIAEFLEEVPPGDIRELALNAFSHEGSSPLAILKWPTIKLYRSNDACAGFRFADPLDSSPERFSAGSERWLWCGYRCRNSKGILKLYAISFTAPSTRTKPGRAIKVGDYPVFGPHLPLGILELLGEDKEYFEPGRIRHNSR